MIKAIKNYYKTITPKLDRVYDEKGVVVKIEDMKEGVVYASEPNAFLSKNNLNKWLEFIETFKEDIEEPKAPTVQPKSVQPTVETLKPKNKANTRRKR